MLNELKELIFGLNSYEKTKIEDRYFIAKKIIKNLSIKKIEDFEILENIIYKIKDELRIKSSNLNKIIKNPKRNLKEIYVNNLLENLIKLKYDFLNQAFKFVNEEMFSNSQIIEDNEIKTQIEEKEILKDNTIFENNEFLAKIENGKIPYILIKFKQEINYLIINKLSSILFETLNAQGTNIIIEKKTILIIPRFTNDNLFTLPRINIDINEIYNKLKLNISNNNENISSKKDFIKISNLRKNDFEKKDSLKLKEDSLDSLLSKISKTKNNFNPNFNLNNETLKPQIIEDEKIKIIKNSKINNELEKYDEIIEEEKETKEEKNQKPKDEFKNQKTKKKYKIYSDDKIIAYLKENSKILGELIIEPIDKISKNELLNTHKIISTLEESSLAYITIFTKVLSSILFETLNASGTNIIYDFKDNKIRIIPRFENDNLTNLKWDTKSNTNEFLEQVKNKLILEMSNELKLNEKKQEKITKPIIKKNDKLEVKAKYILDSLKKIP